MWRVGEPLDMGVCQWCGKACGAWWDVRGVRNAARGSALGKRWGGEVCAMARRARGVGGMAGPADVSVVEQGGWHCRTYARQSLEGGVKGRGAGAAGAGDKVKGVGIGGACTVGSWCWRGTHSASAVLSRWWVGTYSGLWAAPPGDVAPASEAHVMAAW